MSNRGRPRLSHDEKKRTVSISITPLQIQILDQLCIMNDLSRSEVLRGLIEGAGFLELGVVGKVEPHLGNQKYKFPKTGLVACNPFSLKGVCQNSACQAVYKKEGALK